MPLNIVEIVLLLIVNSLIGQLEKTDEPTEVGEHKYATEVRLVQPENAELLMVFTLSFKVTLSKVFTPWNSVVTFSQSIIRFLTGLSVNTDEPTEDGESPLANITDWVNTTCPKCGGKIIEKKTRKGKIFYGCSNFPKCNVAVWDMPTKEVCPKCHGLIVNKDNEHKCNDCNYKIEE